MITITFLFSVLREVLPRAGVSPRIRTSHKFIKLCSVRRLRHNRVTIYPKTGTTGRYYTLIPVQKPRVFFSEPISLPNLEVNVGLTAMPCKNYPSLVGTSPFGDASGAGQSINIGHIYACVYMSRLIPIIINFIVRLVQK